MSSWLHFWKGHGCVSSGIQIAACAAHCISDSVKVSIIVFAGWSCGGCILGKRDSRAVPGHPSSGGGAARGASWWCDTAGRAGPVVCKGSQGAWSRPFSKLTPGTCTACKCQVISSVKSSIDSSKGMLAGTCSSLAYVPGMLPECCRLPAVHMRLPDICNKHASVSQYNHIYVH